MALRRWKPFLSSFAQIDATIEAAGGGASREAFRRERDRIVEALCGAADDGVAEEICALLDAAMAESLVTLRDAVPASAVKDALASGDVVATLGALMRGHASARVRGLARDVVRGWRAGVAEEVATARAALDVLDGVGVSARPLPPLVGVKKTATIFAGYRDNIATKKQAQIIPEKKQADLKKPTIIGRCDAKKQAEIVSEKKKLACPKKQTAAVIVGGCNPETAKVISDPTKSELVLGCVRVNASAYTEASNRNPGAAAAAQEDVAPDRRRRRQEDDGGPSQQRRREEDGGHKTQAPRALPGGRGREASSHDTGDRGTAAEDEEPDTGEGRDEAAGPCALRERETLLGLVAPEGLVQGLQHVRFGNWEYCYWQLVHPDVC